MTKKPNAMARAKAPAKPAKKNNALWEKLAKELRAVIPKLDTEGLAFLVEQSRIHLYNMQVDKLNKLKMRAANSEAANSAAARRGAKMPGAKTAKTKPAQSAKQTGVFRIDPTGTGFYLRSSTGGTMFSKPEMVQLVKIAHGPGSPLETGARLYGWLARERGDVLSTLQIGGRLDKRLGVLAGIIKKNFKLKN